MNNKKQLFINILLIVSILCFSFLLIRVIPKSKYTPVNNNVDNTVIEVEDKKVEKKYDLNSIREQYNNEDIIMYIEIPNVLGTPVCQGEDNDYYLNHDLYKNYDFKGTVELDYRNKLDDRKLLLYGHSGDYNDLAFLPLNNYINESFYKDNKYIYIYTDEYEIHYQIFSSYIETSDFDYVNLNNFNGLSYSEHLNKLKNKSLYDTGVEVNDDKVVILQTCSMNERGSAHYHLVMGKEIERFSY